MTERRSVREVDAMRSIPSIGGSVVLTSLLGLIVGLASAGCSNPACDGDVTRRLFDECRLMVGIASGVRCAGLPDAPTDPNDPAYLEQLIASCEIADPDLDVDCLRNEACDAILMDACGSGEPESNERTQCLRTCTSEGLDCLPSCSSRESSFEACLGCELDCARSTEDCRNACRE